VDAPFKDEELWEGTELMYSPADLEGHLGEFSEFFPYTRDQKNSLKLRNLRKGFSQIFV
jgi:hypothetical protein